MTTWSAMVGARSDDKLSALDRVLARLRERGVRLAGFYQERVLDEAGEVMGWDLVRLSRPERAELARRSEQPDLCDYAFDAKGFAIGADWARDQDADVVVVGGVGKLEAAGGGHWPVVQELIESTRAKHALLCIRDTSLSSVALRLPDPEAHVQLPCEAVELDEFADLVAELASGA